MFAALRAWPGCGRIVTRSSANARSVPSSASVDMAAVTSAIVRRPARSCSASTSIPRIPSVPLISASPSLAVSVSGSIEAASSAPAAATRSPAGVNTSPSPISARPQ